MTKIKYILLFIDLLKKKVEILQNPFAEFVQIL